MHNRIRIQITGTVQGVGFRPFIYNLAKKYRLKGFCLNDSRGILIEVQGEMIDRFIEEIKTSSPPLSRIEELTSRILADEVSYKDFSIRESVSHEGSFTLVSPDIATCQDCIKELLDPMDRRYHYPFINCTNCGPRYSITKNIPYDRSNTTMTHFTMCETCENEYYNPANRRFHAQPNACTVCGPQLMLFNNEGFAVQTQDPISTVCTLLDEGKIVAVKGLGGYHIACDATSHNVVSTLRKRKHRDDKSFAVMINDLDTIKQLCYVNKKEETLLSSPQRPIVLLRKKVKYVIADNVATDNNFLGVMLPYTPLHYLLIAESNTPLVLTSGNPSNEPIVYNDNNALLKLRDIADYFLIHDRKIFMRCDDSVVKVVEDKEMLIRRSRGYAPFPLRLQYIFTKPILACGAFLKNTFCLARGNHAFLSHHIGDLDNAETLDSFATSIEHYKSLFNIKPEVIAYDLHPEYLSTKYAIEQNNISKIAVQHHHAHIVSCMADNGIHHKVIGVAFDGLGYGDDGNFWGGEFFVADLSGYERAGHLDYVPMPGGEQAIKEPRRMAISYLYRIYGENLYNLSHLHPLISINNGTKYIKSEIILKMISQKINAPLTSSMGRLFDGVASIIGLQHIANYEGQAAIRLESIADVYTTSSYPFEININDNTACNSPVCIIRWQKIIESILDDLKNNISESLISAKFHNSIIEIVLHVCKTVRDNNHLNDVVLSGGVFQNNFLLRRLINKLNSNNFKVYFNEKVPCNDGGISLGQAVIASERYRTCA